LSFYLTRPQDAQRSIPGIPSGAEVATERTETEPAIVFSTDQELPLGFPWIRHFLTEAVAGDQPQQVRDRLANQWTRDSNTGRWTGRQQSVFQTMPQPNDAFYLVFDPFEPLDGNVLELTIEGEPAGSTGINPNRPPRQWEAWNGDGWQSVLLAEADDGTKGFSFDDVELRGLAGLSQATVTLHLPLTWPTTTFAGYHGRWLRCRCLESATDRFSRSPQLTTLLAQTVGGRASASECERVQNELVGESDGTPGQTFYLQSQGILARQEGEYLQVTPPGEPPQRWYEVENFADSAPGDRHYTLDARTGRIQFGPLIREPLHLREEVQLRRQVQWQGQQLDPTQPERESLGRHYGAVPPRGATLHMVSYRTGGGDRGNVPRHALRTLKTALPYIKRVTNHEPARDGANEESLEEAVLRVPRLLRTRDRAVTPEDFETLTMQASRSVGRAYCPKQQPANKPGVVTVYVVPRVNVSNWERGLAPEQFSLSLPLRTEIEHFLGDRCLLGTQAQLREPEYVGVAVQAVLGVEPDYQVGTVREDLRRSLTQALYQLLNPLTGGRQGTGWGLAAPLYQSDIVGLLQSTKGVHFLDTVQLFELRRSTNWQRQLITAGVVDPGSTGVICSWAEPNRQSAHRIQILGGEG